MNPKRYERIVATIAEVAFPEILVTDWDYRETDSVTTRQIDVLALSKGADGHSIRIAIEAKNWGNKMDITHIEGYIGKYFRKGAVPVNQLYIASRSGYTKSAIELARQENIELFKIIPSSSATMSKFLPELKNTADLPTANRIPSHIKMIQSNQSLLPKVDLHCATTIAGNKHLLKSHNDAYDLLDSNQTDSLGKLADGLLHLLGQHCKEDETYKKKLEAKMAVGPADITCNFDHPCTVRDDKKNIEDIVSIHYKVSYQTSITEADVIAIECIRGQGEGQTFLNLEFTQLDGSIGHLVLPAASGPNPAGLHHKSHPLNH